MAERVELGRSGVKASPIGVGTWQWGSKIWGYGRSYGEREVEEAFEAALENGVNFFDTAEIYGDGASERILGRLIRDRREEVVVATKLWPTRLTRRGVRRALERSLERLGTSYVDLYQVHWYNPLLPLGRLMRVLEELWSEGKIRAIGVSNFTLEQLQRARETLSHTDIASNQVRYNLIEREAEERLLPYCRREGVTLIAYSPLAQGLLTGKYGVGKVPRDPARRLNPLFTPSALRRVTPLIEVLREIAERRNKTVTQIALNWLIKEHSVTAIPGVKNRRQAEEVAGAMGWRLSQMELEEIEQAAKPIKLSRFRLWLQMFGMLLRAKR